MKEWPKLHRALSCATSSRPGRRHASGPEYESRSNPSESSNPTVTMEWRVKRGSLPEYQHAALLLGDIVHNWRSALDHQLWAITPRREQRDRGRHVQFPIHPRSATTSGG